MDGLRTGLPTRSTMIRVDAMPSPAAPASGATASMEMHTAVTAYPAIVQLQWLPSRSAHGPTTTLSNSDTASAAQVTEPTTSAEAPSPASSGPYTALPPSATIVGGHAVRIEAAR